MATRPQQQLNSDGKEVHAARLPLDRLDRMSLSELEVELMELCRRDQEQSEYEEEEEEELQEQESGSPSHGKVETRKEQKELFLLHTQFRAQDSVHPRSQVERQPSAGAGHSSKDREVLSSPSVLAMPSNADLLASLDGAGSFGSFPSKQVEGVLQSCLTSAEGQVTRLLQQAMDTVQSQVLRALHQAANDIIEHLGKEAAHRVVVAERKAALLELELSSVKQQALSMLFRLKTDSDAQALDADKKFLLERRRAQDAEAKLAIAQDISKRLKVELKKKGDILDKMQKLVQPMADDHSENPSRPMELTGHLETRVRCVSNDRRHRKSPVRSAVEGTSVTMCRGALNDEIHCPELQPRMEAALIAVDDPNEKQSSLSSKTPAAEKESVDLQNQPCFFNEKNSRCSPNHHEEDFLSRKTEDERRGEFLVNEQAELSWQEASCPVESVDPNLIEEDKPEEQMQDAQLLSNSEILDEKVNSVPAICQKNVDGKELVLGSFAPVKGVYVRRKARESGKMQEKKESDYCLHAVTEQDSKADVLRSANETASEPKTDILEGDCQTFTLRRDPQVLLDATDSSSLLGHVVQLVAESHEDLASDLPEDLSSSAFSKGIDLGSSTTRDEVGMETVEFARPDYEVATSLAELASIGLEVRGEEMESLPHTGCKEGIFLKPGRTGLRMKRKGISFERKATLHSEGKVNKKPRPDRLISALTDSHTERILRRNRGGKYNIFKDSLSSESSRDNRRLMQGARQLLCLAEKKW